MIDSTRSISETSRSAGSVSSVSILGRYCTSYHQVVVSNPINLCLGSGGGEFHMIISHPEGVAPRPYMCVITVEAKEFTHSLTHSLIVGIIQRPVGIYYKAIV